MNVKAYNNVKPSVYKDIGLLPYPKLYSVKTEINELSAEKYKEGIITAKKLYGWYKPFYLE